MTQSPSHRLNRGILTDVSPIERLKLDLVELEAARQRCIESADECLSYAKDYADKAESHRDRAAALLEQIAELTKAIATLRAATGATYEAPQAEMRGN